MTKQTFIIAEIGINHNGDINIAKQLINGAREAGCNAVKFQKRTVETVYSKEELDKYRESPWGTTNREQKLGLEFEKAEFDEIDRYCKEKNIEWFASSWDLESQKFIQQYNLNYNKIASAMLTFRELLEMVADEGRHTFISTGMSTVEEIDAAVKIFKDKNCPFELMHTTSTYPMKDEHANLRCIEFLRERYGCDVSYSGHESGGYAISLAAISLGASSLERHITIDRAMYGSDQSASLQLDGLSNLVKGIRVVEKSLGKKEKIVFPEELPCKEKLRKTETLLNNE
jgi:N-acetylneuraminate synthase